MKIQDRALLVQLSIESWGTIRQDKDANRAVSQAKNSSTSATRVSKRLVPDDAFKAVKSKADEARTFIRTMTQPWSDSGARLLDAGQLFALQDDLRQKYRPAWWVEVQKVVNRLDEFRDTWGPANLGDLYDAKLYPTREKMEAAFTWALDVMPLDPSSKDLRMVLGNEYVDEMQHRAEEKLTLKLWERMAEPIQAMADRLSQADSNFKDTLVGNIRRLMDIVPSLNLTADPRIEQFRRKIEEELTRHSPDTLRLSRSARNETAQKAQAILKQMNDFMPGIAPAENIIGLDLVQPAATASQAAGFLL